MRLPSRFTNKDPVTAQPVGKPGAGVHVTGGNTPASSKSTGGNRPATKSTGKPNVGGGSPAGPSTPVPAPTPASKPGSRLGGLTGRDVGKPRPTYTGVSMKPDPSNDPVLYPQGGGPAGSMPTDMAMAGARSGLGRLQKAGLGGRPGVPSIPGGYDSSGINPSANNRTNKTQIQ